jgi:phosphotriesterase-related protein
VRRALAGRRLGGAGMSGPGKAGWAQTVCGLVDPSRLGITMMHEHLLLDLRRIFDEPADPREKVLAHAPVSLENLSWVFLNYNRNRDNLVLDDPDLSVREAALLKEAGGGTLVDVTTSELGRDPVALRTISERTGLHVVMGAGHYHAQFHAPQMSDRSEAEIADAIIRDIEVGVGGSGVKAGIIGEVGCTWPLHPNEVKSLRATARAQRATGAPVTIHPGRHVESPFEVLDVLEGAGADLERVVMGHMERTGLDRPGLLRLARLGCVLEWDWFGEVRPTWPHGRVDVPSDGERIKQIAFLLTEGHGSQIVVSQDVCFKSRLSSYGGAGYAHVVKYVVRWMGALGLAASDIDRILIDNPRRILSFTRPA